MSRNRSRGGKRGPSALLPTAAAPGRAVPRRLRVERHLREELTRALGRLHDPRLAAVAITGVTLTDDLAFARIYVRPGLDGEGDPRPLLRGLEAASGRLRGEMGRALGLRRAPELRFLYDDGVERAGRVEALLAEIEAEAKASAPGLDDEPGDD